MKNIDEMNKKGAFTMDKIGYLILFVAILLISIILVYSFFKKFPSLSSGLFNLWIFFLFPSKFIKRLFNINLRLRINGTN